MPRATAILAAFLASAGADLSHAQESQDGEQGAVRVPDLDRNRRGEELSDFNREPSAESETKSAESEKDEDSERLLKYTPHIAASAGHDTNPDEFDGGDSSAFQRYDLGLRLKYDRKGTRIDFNLRGEIYDFMELSDDPQRWLYEADLEGEVELNKKTDLLFGFERVHDALLDPETINDEAYVGTRWHTASEELRIRGFVEHNQNLSEVDFGAEPPFAFDYIKSGVSTRYMIMADRKIAPFVSASYANLFYPRQDKSFVNRNADDIALIAGARFRPSQKLEIDLGGRYNSRWTDDDFVQHYANGFVDLAVTWRPTDKLEIRGRIERELDATSADGSVVADQTNYSLEADWTPTDKWELNMVAAYQREKEVDVRRDHDWEAGAKLSYNIAKYVQIFADARARRVEYDKPGEALYSYERHVIRAGLETEF